MIEAWTIVVFLHKAFFEVLVMRFSRCISIIIFSVIVVHDLFRISLLLRDLYLSKSFCVLWSFMAIILVRYYFVCVEQLSFSYKSHLTDYLVSKSFS